MSYNFSALKILMVDDDPPMLRILETMLAAMRITNVRGVCCPDEAVEILRDWHPDLIITELPVDPTEGLGFVRRVRLGKDSANPYIPIILITGHTSVRHVTGARDVGVNEILAKPITTEALYGRLVAVLEHPRPYVRTSTYFGPCRRRKDRPYAGPPKRERDGVHMPRSASA